MNCAARLRDNESVVGLGSSSTKVFSNAICQGCCLQGRERCQPVLGVPIATSAEDRQSWALLVRRLQWHVGHHRVFQHLVEESQPAMDWVLGGNDGGIAGWVMSFMSKAGERSSSVIGGGVGGVTLRGLGGPNSEGGYSSPCWALMQTMVWDL